MTGHSLHFLRVMMLCAMSLTGFADEPTLPAGTNLSVRLLNPVGTKSSKVGVEVRGVLIAPLAVGPNKIIPTGAVISGRVHSVSRRSALKPAEIIIRFHSLSRGGSDSLTVDARVQGSDNLREHVSQHGAIHGSAGAHLKLGKTDLVVLAATVWNPALGVTALVLNHFVADHHSGAITLPSGTEFTIALLEPLSISATSPLLADRRPNPDPPEAVVRLAQAVPKLTTRADNGRPSDFTNLLFFADQATLRQTFAKAGWQDARKNSVFQGFRVFFGVWTNYRVPGAPFARLNLEGKPPTLQLEKQMDTFGKRDHIRIWRISESYRGQPVWVAAATHDIRVGYVGSRRRITHIIDPQIDSERTKVIDDLQFADPRIQTFLIERRELLSLATPSDGVLMVKTDGRIAVLSLPN